MPLDGSELTLDSKYTWTQGNIYMTGIQALVRLSFDQARRDAAAGLKTGGFISGYRGSPLGGYDQELVRARKHMEQHNIHFTPGINEDLGATAVWGSQQVGLFPGARVQGVFGLWYGKAPGVDRSGDVFKHANMAGSARFGGALAVIGDDPDCKSSTLPSQSEYAMVDAEIPVLSPSTVQEVLDYGLYGWAMSRFSGAWVSLIALADTMDSGAVVNVDDNRLNIIYPDFSFPPDGVHIRLGDKPLLQEERLRDHKLQAAAAFAVANDLNKVKIDCPNARVGIVATGKAYTDLRQAMASLGIDEARAQNTGIRLMKIGMPWPLEVEAVRRFAHGLDLVIVFENKRPLIEDQLKMALYKLPDGQRPIVVGKRDENEDVLLPDVKSFGATEIARVLLKRLPDATLAGISRVLPSEEMASLREGGNQPLPQRAPFFCSGCPHNTSTNVPEGSRAMAGIGCHYMVTWMDRRTELFSQMGGEGVQWVGQAPFTDEKHVFVNLGDGTYFHSGVLAIRAAVSAKVNATYKVLFNDAVAMTGGQPFDGTLNVPVLAQQISAEGVKKIVVVSDDIEKYEGVTLAGAMGDGPAEIRHRDDLEQVQEQLRETPGVTVIIYDQTCAAEKRRRRKRGKMADPAKRVFINDLVCEGCGDCSVKSNCLSVEPLETEFGRKREINQSSCNKDYSCLNGFCPSFVTVEGGELKKADVAKIPDLSELPLPVMPSLEHPWNIVIGGIGGTGITTLSALLGTAAFLDGKGGTTLDMNGLAQKGGAVMSNVRIATNQSSINGPRVPYAEADLVLAADAMVTAQPDNMKVMHKDRTALVVNRHLAPTAAFVKDRDVSYDPTLLQHRMESIARAHDSIDSSHLAERFCGDQQYANVLMAGFAWQRGWLPIGLPAIERAIELNGAAVKNNKKAFAIGRWAAHDPAGIAAALNGDLRAEPTPETLEQIVARRVEFLTGYQDAAYGDRYARRVAEVQGAETALGLTGLTEAVARYYFKLLAYKDEYEVARLYTDGSFEKKLKAQFQGDVKLKFHLAPPLTAKKDDKTGHLKKRQFGPWMMGGFRVLAKLKGLRGTALDVFGYTAERKAERALIGEYEQHLDAIVAALSPATHATALALASLPDQIRGYGHVKEAAMAKAAIERARLAEQLAKAPAPAARAA